MEHEMNLYRYMASEKTVIASIHVSDNDGGFSIVEIPNVMLSPVPDQLRGSIVERDGHTVFVNGLFVPQNKYELIDAHLNPPGTNIRIKLSVLLLGFEVQSTDRVMVIAKLQGI